MRSSPRHNGARHVARTLSSAVPALAMLLMGAIATGPLTAQTQTLTPLKAAAPKARYAPADQIPDPASILGYPIGQRHMRPDEVVRCFERIAAASDRVTMARHGWSYQGRRLVHAVVTSAENHARLDAIQAANRKLTEAPGDVSDGDIQAMPTIVYAGYGVHGNESSAEETAVLLLYHLAADQSEQTSEMLQRLVVVIDPNINPDGHDRFADSVNNFRAGTPTTDSQDMEHREPWPGGRTNHYWFDINRDWLPVTQRESRARIALWQSWRPQLSLDYHEMGSNSSYFFQPGIPERTNPNTPKSNQELTARIAGYHAAALDAVGQSYFTEERFDDFYYGKGSTYPDVQGAVGILFEQSSSRSLIRETEWGTLYYPTTLRNQTITSLSSLRAAFEMRQDLLTHQRDFYRDAQTMAGNLGHDGWLIGGEASRARELAELLQRHGIHVHRLDQSVAHNANRFSPDDSFVVPTSQPQLRLARALLERMTEFPAKIFYDVSTWTLPLAYGLGVATVGGDAGVSPEVVGSKLDQLWQADEGMPATLSDWRIEDVQSDRVPPKSGHLLPWTPQQAPMVLARLHRAGVPVRMARSSFTAALQDGSQRMFPMGTLFVPSRGPLAKPALCARLCRQLGVECVPVDTARTPEGPDLGGSDFPLLDDPQCALIGGPGASGYRVGEIFHLFGERMGQPISLLEGRELDGFDLTRYRTMILPSGAYRALQSDDVEALKTWHRRGGVLVALGTSTAWAARSGFAEAEERQADSGLGFPEMGDLPFGELNDARALQRIAGAYFQATLDPTHPIAAGLPNPVPLFRTHTTMLQWRARGETVARYTALGLKDTPLLSGYASTPRQRQIAQSAAVIAQRRGGGRTVLILDDVAFRGFQRCGERLLLNAVFFGGAF